MSAIVLLAASSAAGISMLSALFGVGIARMMWADDLKFTRQLEAQRVQTDAIRDQGEAAMRGTIAAQEERLKTQEQHIKLLTEQR